MREPPELADLESELSRTMRHGAGTWTPLCAEPEDIVGLITRRGEQPGAVELLAHIALCPYCRREYKETLEAVAALGSGRQPVPPNHAQDPSIPAPLLGSRPFHFDWTGFAASSDTPEEAVTLFVGGALRISLWVDGESLILSAEGARHGLWRMEGGRATLGEGVGVRLDGELVRYSLESHAGGWSGYFALPGPPAPSVAELTIGNYRDVLEGDLVCQLSSAEELADSQDLVDSIRRANDRPSLQAWVDWAQRQLERHPDVAQQVFREVEARLQLE